MPFTMRCTQFAHTHTRGTLAHMLQGCEEQHRPKGTHARLAQGSGVELQHTLRELGGMECSGASARNTLTADGHVAHVHVGPNLRQ